MPSSGAAPPPPPLISPNANIWGRFPTFNALARAVLDNEVSPNDFSMTDLTKCQSALANWNTLEDEKRAMDRATINNFLHEALRRQFDYNKEVAAGANVTTTTVSASTSIQRASVEISEVSETVVCATNSVNNNQGNPPAAFQDQAQEENYFGDVSAGFEEDTEELTENNNEVQFLGRFCWQTPPHHPHQLHQSFFDVMEEDTENVED